MIYVDAAAIKVAVRMEPALGLEKLSSAGENNVRNFQQLGFAFDDRRRCATELREFIHAIVDGADFVHLTGESGDGHWVVKPLNRLVELSAQWAGQRFLHERAPM